MAVRWIPATALLLGACAAACAQDYNPVLPPAARLAPMPGSATFADPVAPVLPPLLPVPPPAVAPRKPCLPCHTDYQPNHVYLPEANPDCGAGGCDGECRECRRGWASLSFLIGGSEDLGNISRGLEFGIQGTGGFWFSDAKSLGLDLSFLNVHQPHKEYVGVTLQTSPLTVTTADANLRAELLTDGRYRLDGLVGYRFAELRENIFTTGPPGVASDLITRNHVNAGQVGLVGDYRFGSYFCEVLAKVGLGHNAETVTINGVQTTASSMALIPEFGGRVGYILGEGVWMTMGYTFLYMNNVARPGRGDSGFYLHGFTIGMECRF